MEKKLLVTMILVVIASLSIAGCTTSSTPVSPTPAATASSTNSPTLAIGTWSGSIRLHNPPNYAWEYPQGSSVTLDIHMFSGTSTPLAGQTVTLTSNGQQVATAVTNSNGDAQATISTAGWAIGHHDITASLGSQFFSATWFSVIAAK